ncbi:MAG: chitobiase/beta-hexosaminidase C-terminal domain-containing protein [Ruminiclostridium sp.]|nr:chitobiase/beta-hexosaminidase C-terminal domain-containing protein [Ruminiclostridium sp.]
MNKAINKVLAVILAFFVLAAAFAVIPPVSASAASIISSSVNYSGKYVLLTLTPKSSSNTIYYTTNGTKPGKSSSLYTNTLAAESKTMIRAVEYNKSGKQVASVKVTIKPRVQTPKFTMKTKNGASYLTIATATSGAKIYYTTDGSTPTKRSKLYTGAITLKGGMTVKARAYKTDFKSSTVTAYKFSDGTSAKSDSKQSAGGSDIETIVALVNSEREKAGLSPLALNDQLCEVAQKRAEEVSAVFSHNRPDGSSCFNAIDESGFPYLAAGENIAAGQSDGTDVMNSWMNSSGHRANILSSAFGKIGIGCYNSNGVKYWVQIFTD